MSATTNFSPILAPVAPIRATWRLRLAGWLARLVPARRRTTDIALPAGLGTHLSRDMGLPADRSLEDGAWGTGGMMWR
ncbi:hypothetical protein [Falsiroseomonas oryzae]|uniref:hypothetical protein n=1 Tax=Falsiroseomonas oryzae TaxID=2766473 RepID=UPI0022EA2F3A|nr:hypothetical protein [Roseomonas sp. MO-31]